MKLRRIILTAASTALGLVFVLAAMYKVTDSGMSREGPRSGVELFASQLRQQGVLPSAMTDWTARIVVMLEVTLGVWLLLHVRITAVLWVSVGLFTLFAVYLMVLLVTSGDQECACFGTQSHQLASSGLWKNAVLTGIAAMGLAAARRSAEPRTEPVGGR